MLKEKLNERFQQVCAYLARRTSGAQGLLEHDVIRLQLVEIQSDITLLTPPFTEVAVAEAIRILNRLAKLEGGVSALEGGILEDANTLRHCLAKGELVI